MRIVWTAITIAGLVLGAIPLVAVGDGVLVLLAHGVGLLLNRVMHLQPFEATILSLVGVSVSAWALVRLVVAFGTASFPTALETEAAWDEDDFEDDQEDEDEETEADADRYPGIPRWRQPVKPVDFSRAQAEERCPCGSGRKYNNCHGAKRVT